MNEATEYWFIKVLKEMIQKKIAVAMLGKMKIVRQPSTLTTFNFSISINKSAFEEILSEEEKQLLWLEEGGNNDES